MTGWGAHPARTDHRVYRSVALNCGAMPVYAAAMLRPRISLQRPWSFTRGCQVFTLCMVWKINYAQLTFKLPLKWITMQKQIRYGIFFSCLGVAAGFAIGFPIINLLPYEQRGYIGVPLILVLCIGLAVAGGILGVRIAGPEFPDED